MRIDVQTVQHTQPSPLLNRKLTSVQFMLILVIIIDLLHQDVCQMKVYMAPLLMENLLQQITLPTRITDHL